MTLTMSLPAALGIVGQQRDMLEEGRQGVELLQGVGQLLQVLQPALGLGRAVGRSMSV